MSQADSSYIQDKHLNSTLDTKMGLIHAGASVTQLDEWPRDVHYLRPALCDYLSQCLGCWQHVTKYLSILISCHICLYSKSYNFFVRSTCDSLLCLQWSCCELSSIAHAGYKGLCITVHQWASNYSHFIIIINQLSLPLSILVAYY